MISYRHLCTGLELLKLQVEDRIKRMLFGEIVLKPGKRQETNKEAKIYFERFTTSFVFHSYTMHKLRNRNVSIG